MTGKKFDEGKLRYDLIPPVVLEQLAAVLTKGAAKYGENNWQQVPDANRRYYAAAMRHLQSHMSGDLHDDETGLPHITHALACVAFMTWGTVHGFPQPIDDVTPTTRSAYCKELYTRLRPLYNFLIHTGYFDSFVDNLVCHNKDCEPATVLVDVRPEDLFYRAFTWENTPEGHDYWSVVNLRWQARFYKPAFSVADERIPDDSMDCANGLSKLLGTPVKVYSVHKE